MERQAVVNERVRNLDLEGRKALAARAVSGDEAAVCEYLSWAAWRAIAMDQSIPDDKKVGAHESLMARVRITLLKE